MKWFDWWPAAVFILWCCCAASYHLGMYFGQEEGRKEQATWDAVYIIHLKHELEKQNEMYFLQ